MLRRRPKLRRVRHTLRNMPPDLLASEYGEEIVRLRDTIHRAVDLLEGQAPTQAEALLRATLERERWWK